jgi:hypothetical protein
VLRRMGHHRVERFVTIPLTINSSIAAYHNLQKSQADYPMIPQ